MRGIGKVIIAAALVAAASSPAAARGPANDLDHTFGPGGVGIWNPTCCFYAGRAALQSDGKIVVSGELNVPEDGWRNFELYRLTPEGLLDTTFSGDGIRRMNFGGQGGQPSDSGRAVLIQSGGKLLEIGNSDAGTPPGAKVAMVRYLANGRLDTTFGDGGRLLVPTPGGFEMSGSIGVQDAVQREDGTFLVLAGLTNAHGDGFATYAFTADGELDPTWGDGGIAFTDPNGSAGGSLMPEAIAVQPDGRVVTGGWSYEAGGFALRYRADGRLDRTFDHDGRLALPELATVNDVVPRSGGGLVFSGVAKAIDQVVTEVSSGDITTAHGYRFARLVARRSDGRLDGAFGNHGIAQVRFTDFLSRGAHAVAQGGRIILSASVFDRWDVNGCEWGEFVYRPVLVRFNGGGTRDRNFSGDGVASGPVDTDMGQIADLLLQRPTKVVAEGVDGCPWRQPDARVGRFLAT